MPEDMTTERRIIIDDVPETASDERMHVLADDCWCGVATYRELGHWRRKHFDGTIHYDIGPDQTACGARVRVTAHHGASNSYNCTRNRNAVTCLDCQEAP